MTRRAFTIAFAAVCLSACTMIPEYSRPAPPVPAGWPTGPAYEGNRGIQAAPPAADVGWRDFYTDERMQKVILAALVNNRDLRIAALNIEVARGQYRIQRAQLFPTVSAFGDTIQERVPSSLSVLQKAQTVKQFDVGVGVSSWEIDFFGRIRSLKQSALQQYLATEQALRAAQISLMAEVAYAYMTLAADRDNLKLSRATFVARQSSFDLIERRFKVGSSSALDVRQAQTLLESARADVIAFTRVVALDENALNLVVGAPVPAELLAEELAVIAPPRDVSPGLSSDVLLNRPDILQAESLLKSANANIGAARANFFPRVLLTSTVGASSSQLAGLWEAGSGVWSFTPQITLPIFDAGSRFATLAVSKATRDIYIAAYEKSIQAAFREVADSLAQRGTITSQLAAQEALVKASEETYRLSNARYMKGIDSFLNVLDAQRSLYSAQQGLITLRLARLSYLVTMYKVLGGGA